MAIIEKDRPLFPFKDQYSERDIDYLQTVSIKKVFTKGRLKNVLPHEGYETMWDVLQISQKDITEIRHVGQQYRYELASITLHWLKENDILPDGVDIDLEIKGIPEVNKDVLYYETEKVIPNSEDYILLNSPILQTSINEIPYCGRVEKVLRQMNVRTVQDVLNLKWAQFNGKRGIGIKSKQDLVWKTEQWLKTHKNLHLKNVPQSRINLPDETEDPDRFRINLLADFLSPISEDLNLYQIKKYLSLEKKGIDINDHTNKVLRKLLVSRSFRPSLTSFFKNHFPEGICSLQEFDNLLDTYDIFRRYPDLKNIYFLSGSLRLKDQYVFEYRMTLKEYLVYLANTSEAKAVAIFIDKLGGLTMDDLIEKYKCSPQNLHLHLNNIIGKIPELYEDYFSEVYQVAGINKETFLRDFPEISDFTYEYLGLRYGKNESVNQKKIQLNECQSRFAITLKDALTYSGIKSVKDYVLNYVQENCPEPTPIRKIQEDLLHYLESESKSIPSYISNIDQLKSFLRSSPGIVFNKKKEARCFKGNPEELWNHIDFSPYRDQTVSTVKIYFDNLDLMRKNDVRDGYELYSLIKNSEFPASIFEKYDLEMRRIPILVFGSGAQRYSKRT